MPRFRVMRPRRRRLRAAIGPAAAQPRGSDAATHAPDAAGGAAGVSASCGAVAVSVGKSASEATPTTDAPTDGCVARSADDASRGASGRAATRGAGGRRALRGATESVSPRQLRGAAAPPDAHRLAPCARRAASDNSGAHASARGSP